jgi:hypothetical protein
LGVDSQHGADCRGGECAVSDGRGASMHECVARYVASEMDSLCQGALCEKITYRRVLTGQES